MTASVEVEAKRSGPVEYPCVMRFHHGRLFAFLQGQVFTRAFQEYVHMLLVKRIMQEHQLV